MDPSPPNKPSLFQFGIIRLLVAVAFFAASVAVWRYGLYGVTLREGDAWLFRQYPSLGLFWTGVAVLARSRVVNVALFVIATLVGAFAIFIYTTRVLP